MYGINYSGLRKRESYDDLVKYIETDPNKIKYPQRTATFIEHSHYMKHLGGEDYMAMEEQQLRASKEKVKEDIIRERAGGGEGTSSLIREEVRREAPPPMARREATPPSSRMEPPVETKTPMVRRRGKLVETRKEDIQPPPPPPPPMAVTETPVATAESVSPAIAEGIEKAVEAEKGKKTDRRFRNQKMVIEELGNTTRIPEAGRTADVNMQPKPTPAPKPVRGSSPVIQIVEDTEMEPVGNAEEFRYTKASMRRMRKKGTFPEPFGNPVTYKPNANAASSNDPAGSSASADYQRRLREEELLRLEKERLVSQKLESDKKEAARGRSRTVKKKKEKEPNEADEESAPKSKKKKDGDVEETARAESKKKEEQDKQSNDADRERSRSKQGKRRGKEKEKEPEAEAEKPKAKRPTSEEASQKPKKPKASSQMEIPAPMTKTEKKEAKKRQQEEQKAEEKQDKRRKPTAKEESKTQYFEIGDVERPKTKKKEEKKEEKPKAQKAEEPKKKEEEAEQQQEARGPKQHGTKIDNKKTKSYWEKKSNAYIIDQLSLHGIRIDPSLITGKKVEIDPALDRKVTTKVKKITKAELLDMLYKALKVS